MKLTVVGITDKFSFKSDNGQTIEGYNLYFSKPLSLNNRGAGIMVDKKFVNSAHLSYEVFEFIHSELLFNPSLDVGIVYNDRGKIEDVYILDN